MESPQLRWPSLGRPIQAAKQRLVEGRTPEIFFREWVEALELEGDAEVRDYGSLADLTPYLKVFTTYKDFRELVNSVAIIRDAEDKPATFAFDSVCAALRTVGLPCPTSPASFSDGMPRTGIFVLPDCQQSGMLETLCWSALQSDHGFAPQLGCVTTYLNCLKQANTVIRNETKARVWTYLAGKGHFDPQVGRAAQAKVWDWTSPALQQLSVFLKAL
jgi:hypothetical protein